MLPRSAARFNVLRRSFATWSWKQAAVNSEAVRMSPTVERLDERPVYNGKVQGVILDWSGTTADEHVLAPAVVFVDVFKRHGVEISMPEARGPMGLRKDLHIAEILEIPEVRQRWMDIKGEEPTQATVDMLFKDFVPMQCECLNKYTGLIEGCADAVSALKAQGIKIGSTTGFTKVMVDILLADAKEQGYVPDSSVAGDQVDNNMGFRPAPFMLYKNMNNLKVWPTQAIVKVDDTVSGVGEGLSAGCWSIGLYGLSNYTDVDSNEEWAVMSEEEKERRQEVSRQMLLTSGAHYVAKSIADLPMIVEDINARLAKGEQPGATTKMATQEA